jgi:hypothetical protein
VFKSIFKNSYFQAFFKKLRAAKDHPLMYYFVSLSPFPNRRKNKIIRRCFQGKGNGVAVEREMGFGENRNALTWLQSTPPK